MFWRGKVYNGGDRDDGAEKGPQSTGNNEDSEEDSEEDSVQEEFQQYWIDMPIGKLNKSTVRFFTEPVGYMEQDLGILSEKTHHRP